MEEAEPIADSYSLIVESAREEMARTVDVPEPNIEVEMARMASEPEPDNIEVVVEVPISDPKH